MKKLTKEEILSFSNTCYGRMLGKQLSNQVVGELLQYKQLEEQIGCPLEVVFKALNNNFIYYQNDNGYLIEVKGIKLVKLCEWCLTNGNHYPMTKYYKSNWWLKEDKSE